MVRLIRYFKWWYYPVIVMIVSLIYFQIEFDLQLIDYIADIIRAIGVASKTGTSQTDVILNIGTKMIFITLGSITATVIASFFAARVGSNLAKNLRSKLYNKVDGFFFRRNKLIFDFITDYKNFK